jgi:hypothetical protein
MTALRRLLLASSLLAFGLAAAPAFAKEPPADPGPRLCKKHPNRCEEMKERRHEFCKKNPQTCEVRKEELEARRKMCKEHPNKCEKLREERKQRRAERRQNFCMKHPGACDDYDEAEDETGYEKQRSGPPR